MHIVISRTDSIGDVILTLPMAGIIKEKYPQAKITFLGKTYTKAIIESSKHVDKFLNFNKLEIMNEKKLIEKLIELKIDTFIHVFPNKKLAKAAKKAKIKERIGTYRRTFHLLTCNKGVWFSRKNSNLHEAILNTKLLTPLKITKEYSKREIGKYLGFKKKVLKNSSLIDTQKFNLILHPLSQGSAVEWGQENFSELIDILPKNKFKIFISGTRPEGQKLKSFLEKNSSNITDLTGKFSLDEFIEFISSADGIIAASTGPLHIGAMSEINALGLFSKKRPIHPGRWAPIGKNADFITSKESFDDPIKEIQSITPKEVLEKISNWKKT